MRKIISSAMISAVIFCATSSVAIAGPIEDALNPQLGTISVKFEPAFDEGNLYACTLIYKTLIRDYVYKSGGFSLINGNIGIVGKDKILLVNLKVIGYDVEKDGSFTPYQIDDALFNNGLTTSLSEKIGGQQTDFLGRQSIFKMETVGEKLMDNIVKGSVPILFRRHGGGIDVPFSISTKVISTDDNGIRNYSMDEILKFFDCNKTLLENLIGEK